MYGLGEKFEGVAVVLRFAHKLATRILARFRKPLFMNFARRLGEALLSRIDSRGAHKDHCQCYPDSE
jgi:hypothetical protein